MKKYLLEIERRVIVCLHKKCPDHVLIAQCQVCCFKRWMVMCLHDWYMLKITIQPHLPHHQHYFPLHIDSTVLFILLWLDDTVPHCMIPTILAHMLQHNGAIGAIHMIRITFTFFMWIFNGSGELPYFILFLRTITFSIWWPVHTWWPQVSHRGDSPIQLICNTHWSPGYHKIAHTPSVWYPHFDDISSWIS